MARVIIKRDFAEDVIKRTNEKVETLLNTISTLGVKLNTAKTVYNSDNTSGASFDDMSETINKIISSYSSLSEKFAQALRDNIEEYSKADKQISSNVNAVSSVTLTAGTASSLTSHAANTADNVNAGKFLSENELSKDSFEKDGEYSFEYRSDGSVKVNRDGEPLVFTDKTGADWVAGNRNDDINVPYQIGVGSVDSSDPDYQKRAQDSRPHLYNNAPKEAINAYEQGVRDASINKKAANEAIQDARQIEGTDTEKETLMASMEKR